MKVCFLSAALLLLPVQAFASAACYSEEEIQAEQLLRLHSELMVTTVTCQTDAMGHTLVPAYTGFTKANYASIRQAEQTLMSFYKKTGKGDATKKLDELRTRLGNEYGQEIASISAPAFCAKYRDQVIPTSEMKGEQVEAEVAKLQASARTYAPSCGSKVASKK